MTNTLMVIRPYWYNNTWVFDDETVGLDKEPFVAGIPQMIDNLVKDIPNARNGFRLLFSASPFPNHVLKITKLREDYGGNWYKLEGTEYEGWLCPALFKYFEKAPEAIYVSAEPLKGTIEYDPGEIAALRVRVTRLEEVVEKLAADVEAQTKKRISL